MAGLVYPAFPTIPQYESSLAAFMPAFDKGRADRKAADDEQTAEDEFGKYSNFITGQHNSTAVPNSNLMALARGSSAAPSPSTNRGGLMALLGLGNKPAATPMPPTANPDGSTAGQPSLKAAGVPNSAEQQAMQYYMGKGYSQHQAAGIVGNLIGESGLNTGAVNPGDGTDGSDSIGVGQWNGPRAVAFKQYAAQNGGNASDLITQLGFVDHELNTTESGVRERLLQAQDPIQAAAAFVGYERPQGYSPENPYASNGWGTRAEQAARLAGGSYSVPQGGGMPQQRGQSVTLPPPEILQGLFSSPVTRPIAIALAQASIEGQQLPEYTTFSAPDGSLMQMETRSGQISVVQQGQKPQLPTDDMQEYNFYRDQETSAGRQPKPFGEWLQTSTKSGSGLSTQPSWGRDAQGNSVLGQIGADGAFHPTTMPDGVTPIDPAEMAGGRARSTVLGREGGGVQFDLPNAELTAQQTLNAIDKLRVLPDPANPKAEVNPGADETFGNFGGIIPQQWFGSAPGTLKRDFEVAREQLQGKVFLQAFGMLKGGGQITEVEGLKAEQALAKLSTAQSPQAFQEGLDEFRQAVQDGLAKLKQQAGTPYTTNGAPAAPAGGGQQESQDLTGASDADLMRLLGI